MASLWPRSSAPTPGYAPAVSIIVTTGSSEPLRKLHDALGFAVTLRPGHAEISPGPFAGIAALLMAHQRHAAPTDATKPCHYGGVIGIHPIAVQLLKPGAQPVDIIQRVGSQGVPGNLGDLPGCQLGEYVPGQFTVLLPHLLNFIIEIELNDPLLLFVIQLFFLQVLLSAFRNPEVHGVVFAAGNGRLGAGPIVNH